MKKVISAIPFYFGLIAVVFSFSSAIAHGANSKFESINERERIAINSELAELKSIQSGIVKNLFFMRAFDGLVPVPTRFTIRIDKSRDIVSISFLSPNELAWQIRGGSDAVKDLKGSIVFGEYNEKFEKSLHERMTLKKTEKRKDLQIRIFQQQLTPWPIVVVNSSSEYLVIGDQNEKLWEAMLENYFFLKNKTKQTKMLGEK